MGATAGVAVRDERLRRRWTLRDLADRAGVSPSQLQELESGRPVSLETYARVTTGLDLWPELIASDPRKRQQDRVRDHDIVHAAMAELEVSRLRRHGLGVAIDEPYQHYQFAGRADVIAWDAEARALLHIENRTRFPNLQEALGSYAAKRSYLADVLASRLSIRGEHWHNVTHVMAVLWSAEVLHSLRLRTETFRAACPGPADDFFHWWAGRPALATGSTSTLVLMDPSPALAEARRFATLDDLPRLRPRYRGYADAVDRLRR